MKVKLAIQTGCPAPMFIVETEDDTDMLLMNCFINFPHEAKHEWKFCMHSYGGSENKRSFAFGWGKINSTSSTAAGDEK